MTGRERNGRFVADLASVRSGRHFVRDVLLDWDLEQLVDDAQLCVSEIVTNAVTHAGTDVAISVRNEDDAVVVEVHDGVPTMVPQQPAVAAPLEATSGRGMHIVAALSVAWGVRTDSTGKVIWFRLPVPGEGSRSADADVLSMTGHRSATIEPSRDRRAHGAEQARSAS